MNLAKSYMLLKKPNFNFFYGVGQNKDVLFFGKIGCSDSNFFTREMGVLEMGYDKASR